MVLLLLLAVSPSDVAHRVEDVRLLIEGAEKLALVAAAFLTTGVGGVLLAFRGIKAQLKAVESRVEPAVSETHAIKREVSEEKSGACEPDTLRERVEAIALAMESEKALRESQHEANTERLDNMAADMKETRDDVKTMRTLLMKLLGKQAGL